MPRHARNRRFLLVFLLGLVGILLIAAMNVLIDPYLVFDTPRHDGFNRWKTRFFYQHYASKTLHVQSAGARHLILGTSTAGASLRPAHPLFTGQRTFNYALAGSTPAIQLLALRHAVSHNPVKSVILCVDFFAYNAFNEHDALLEATQAMRLPDTATAAWRQWRRQLESQLAQALSYRATSDALGTIAGQRSPGYGGRFRDIGTDGLWQNPRPVGWSQPRMFRVIERQYLGSGWFPDPARRFALTDAAGHSPLDKLRAILEFSAGHDIAVTILIMPFHARLAEAMQLAGLWDDFENLKRGIVRLGEGMPGSRVDIWDFSGYNELTMDPIRDAGHETPWFEDAIHPSVATGDRMLDRVQGLAQGGDSNSATFGSKLDAAQQEQVYRDSLVRREEYLRLNPRDVEEVRALAEETRSYREARLQSGPAAD